MNYSDLKILIIDDHPSDREMISFLLNKRLGCQILETDSKDSALKMIEQHQPHLVLLDLQLDVNVSGLEVLSEIRKQQNSIQLPVIMITGNTDNESVVTSLKAGANDYITKPFHIEVTLSRVEVLLIMTKALKENEKLHQLETINTMVATYNHEINNPLAVAAGKAELILRRDPENKELLKIKEALFRISDIVKKIEQTAKSGIVEFVPYSDRAKLLNLKK